MKTDPKAVGTCAACGKPIENDDHSYMHASEHNKTYLLMHFQCYIDGLRWAAKQAAKKKEQPQ